MMEVLANKKIMKFGGSSVGSVQSIKQVYKIVKNDTCPYKVIVTSAPYGITDLLSELMQKPQNLELIQARINTLTDELKLDNSVLKNILDHLQQALRQTLPLEQKCELLLSYGEIMGMHLLTSYFQSRGMATQAVDSREFLVTDSNFGRANYDFDSCKAKASSLFKRILNQDILPITTGFIGMDQHGRTTTLGRGGSDLSASLLGACLQADVIEIWTDTDGIMSADPHIVNNAKLIPEITYKEVIELSNFGAEVLYHRALTPALRSQIPIRVRNTFNLASAGTLIKKDSHSESFCVSLKRDVQVITVFNPEMIGTSGYLSQFFKIFEKSDVSIDVISVSEASVSVTVHHLEQKRLYDLAEQLSSMGEVRLKENCHIVTVISKYLDEHQYMFWQSLKYFSDEGIDINIMGYGNTDINLTFVIDQQHGETVARQLHGLFQEKFS